MYDVETALTEDMLGGWVTFDASGAGRASVFDDGLSGAAGEAVIGCEGPVRAYLVEIKHDVKIIIIADEKLLYHCSTIIGELLSSIG